MDTDPVEVVKAYYAALDAESVDKAARYLAAGMYVTGSTGELIDREAYLSGLRLLRDAVPDAKIALIDIKSDGKTVSVNLQVSGTHTGTMDFSAAGVVAPSKRFVVFPAQQIEHTLGGGEIQRMVNLTPLPPASQDVGGALWRVLLEYQRLASREAREDRALGKGLTRLQPDYAGGKQPKGLRVQHERLREVIDGFNALVQHGEGIMPPQPFDGSAPKN